MASSRAKPPDARGRLSEHAQDDLRGVLLARLLRSVDSHGLGLVLFAERARSAASVYPDIVSRLWRDAVITPLPRSISKNGHGTPDQALAWPSKHQCIGDIVD